MSLNDPVGKEPLVFKLLRFYFKGERNLKKYCALK